MYQARFLLPLVSLLFFSACGTNVPDIQDFGGPLEEQSFVQAIITNVTCEVQDTFYALHQAYPKGTFVDDWGVQITLSLTVDEKGGVSPTAAWLPNGVFALSGGGSVSSEAMRVQKLNWYYLVKDFYKSSCPADLRGGPFLLQSDLKLKETLTSALTAETTKTIDFTKDTANSPFKANVISHEVKFDVVTSGNLTPAWKLTRVSVNPTGSFLSLSRDRTHDLLITIGPADTTYISTETAKGKTKKAIAVRPTEQASAIHNSALIGEAVADALRSSLR